YQVGNFPPLWSEWNGKYRDAVRDYWRGAEHSLPDFARRFTGSADLYESTGRRPHASINFVTAHDGFTLRDLVSYNQKHNLANGEDNRDGESHNRSWNCGVEGITDDPEVLALRSRQQRNLLATLFLSQGVPMLVSGDELGRTQRGNNNAYNQDSELSWIDWQKIDDRLLSFTQQLVHLTRAHPVFRRRRWFKGHVVKGTPYRDIGWFTPTGEEMTDADWDVGYAKSLGVFINGSSPLGRDRFGRELTDSTFFALINAWADPLSFRLPASLMKLRWESVFDTADTGKEFQAVPVFTDRPIETAGRSVVLLRCLDTLPGPDGDAESTEDLF
ncbi:MAG: glycogen debranching enzyme, partial [Myxococcota bacterium]